MIARLLAVSRRLCTPGGGFGVAVAAVYVVLFVTAYAQAGGPALTALVVAAAGLPLLAGAVALLVPALVGRHAEQVRRANAQAARRRGGGR